MEHIPIDDEEDDFYRRLGKPVLKECDGMRLDAYLGHYFKFLSRASWQRRIEKGEVLISGKQVFKTSAKIAVGDELIYFHPEEREPPINESILPFYESDGVLGANKPAHLPMHEGGKYRKQTFARWIKEVSGEKWAAVHRLDRETSGIVLCGDSYEIRQALGMQFRKHEIEKTYLAIVFGIPEKREWTVEAPIGVPVSSEIRIKKWVAEDGQYALTRFELIESRGRYSLLRCYPKTGRTNQIRIHAAYSGHSLVGDKLFFPEEAVFLDYWANGVTEFVLSKVEHSRCLLHAEQLVFTHPVSKDRCHLKVNPPEDWRIFWDSLIRSSL